MAQEPKEHNGQPKQKKRKSPHLKSAMTGAARLFGGVNTNPQPKRSTVSAPSQAPGRPPEWTESKVGDSLDTAGMPRPKPASVNAAAFDSLYGEKKDTAYESSAEREFDQSYAGSADITISEVARTYLQKTWVRLALGAFGILLVIFFIYQLYLNVYTDIKTETANITVYTETIDTQGVAIRDESAIGGSMSESSVSAVKNGEKVLKGQPVINIFRSGKAAAAYERMDEIDRQIAELESMVTASEDSANAVSNIEKLIDGQMVLLSEYNAKGDLGKLADVRGEIAYLLNKRLVAMRKVENYQDRIDELTREKQSLAAAYSQNPSTINAPSSGYYVQSLDGYESLLNTSMLKDLTATRLDKIMSRQPTVPENATGKLLKDFTWYLACPVPVKEAEDYLSVGSVYTLLLPYSETGSMQGTLLYLNGDDSSNCLAIFQCTSLLSELCNMRSQPVKIQIRSYRGFNIKKGALHVRVKQVEEKDKDGNVTGSYEVRYPCVYIMVGNQITPKKVDILYNGDKFVICAVNSDNDTDYLSLYDDVVTEGKGLYAGKIVD